MIRLTEAVPAARNHVLRPTHAVPGKQRLGRITSTRVSLDRCLGEQLLHEAPGLGGKSWQSTGDHGNVGLETAAEAALHEQLRWRPWVRGSAADPTVWRKVRAEAVTHLVKGPWHLHDDGMQDVVEGQLSRRVQALVWVSTRRHRVEVGATLGRVHASVVRHAARHCTRKAPQRVDECDCRADRGTRRSHTVDVAPLHRAEAAGGVRGAPA
mmetsp:Transcript_30753/g.84476  ORF Transcript_30753/g.84476 Transcript_30753/m.84476 type:complete len:211 (+) Transcript_30753:958-1590(+)